MTQVACVAGARREREGRFAQNASARGEKYENAIIGFYFTASRIA